MPKFIMNGIQIYYEIKGDESSTNSLIFLNGVMASVTSWYPLLEHLPKLNMKIILFDFKGQLKSDKPSGPYTFKDHATELSLLMDHLNIDKAHLVGTSYGAEVGMAFSVYFSHRVQSLTLINAASELDDSLKRQVNVWKMLAQSYDGYHFFKVMAPMIYHEDYLSKYDKELEERALVMKKLDNSYFDGQIALYETFLDDLDMTKLLNKITVNTLVIGSEDDYLKPLKFSEIIHDNILGSEYIIIPRCGHVAIFEKPNVLATIIAGFIMKNT